MQDPSPKWFTSQCAVDAAHSSRAGTDSELTLRLAPRFNPAFAGQKTVYTLVSDQG